MLNQQRLIEWLNPIGFNPEVHKVIKSLFEGYCNLCYKKYYKGEYITFNPEKKKARHINCEAIKDHRQTKKNSRKDRMGSVTWSTINIKKR